MSTSVGTLTIEIAANIARLQTDMNAAKRVVGDAMGDVTRVVNAAKTAFIALGGVVSAGALVQVVNGAIEAKARLADLSLTTGITVEALSGLQRVGKFSNTSLDDIAGASNKLAKALFTQTEESKGAAQALKALGLDFEAFRRMQAEQQFVAVAHAMAQFADGTEKSAAAMMLYGKTGAQLLPFLKGLEERGYAAGKQTSESARQAKQYEDNLVELKTAGDAWRRTFAEGVLPTLINITDAVIEARKGVDDFNVAGEALKVTLETLSVLGVNVAFVFEGIGREIGARAAQAVALSTLDFEAVTAIQRELDADNERARAKLDETEKRLLGLQAKIGSASDFQRGDKDTTPVGRPRLKLAGTEGAAGGAKAADDAYTALIAKIREKVALDQAELDAGRKLTETEKFRLQVQKDVQAQFDKLTPARRADIAAATEQAIAVMQQHAAWEAQTRQMEEARAANDAYIESQRAVLDQAQQQRDMAREQLAQYGLTREALADLEAARLRDAAAALERNAALAEDVDLSGTLSQLYREQAQALRDNAAARESLLALQQADSEDALRGADAAVREYLANVRRAGDSTYYAVANAMQGLEDATTSILSGGNAKDAARAWVNGIIAEITRLGVVRPMLAQIFGGGSGMGSTFGSFANLIGGFIRGGMGSNPSGFGGTLNNPSAFVATSLAVGTDYVPYDGFLASLHKGERVVPAAFNPSAGGAAAGGINVNVINNAGAEVSTQQEPDGSLTILLERAAEAGASRGYAKVVADLSAGTGRASAALKSRGVDMGNAALRRT